MKKRSLSNIKILLTLFIFLFSLSACIEIHIDGESFKDGDKVKVKGVTLEHKRTILIRDTKDYGKFNAEVHHGNIELIGSNKYFLEVEIYEKTEDDLVLTLKDGILTGETKSGKPFAIGNIKGTLPNDINVTIDSGAGNVKFSDFKGQNFNLNVGAGSVNIRNCDLNNIIANTGAGNIEISEVSSEEIECNSGVGNINVYNSSSNDATLSTGIGDISISDCNFEKKDFSTGIGKINYDKNGYDKPSVKEL